MNGKGRVSCEFCNATFDDVSDLPEHMQQHAREEQEQTQHQIPFHSCLFSDLICLLCGKNFTNQLNYNLHVAKHKTETPGVSQCLHWKCQQPFRNADDLIQHTQDEHGEDSTQTWCDDRPFQCATCSFSFKTERDLQEHEDARHSVRPFKCGYCCVGFIDGASYEEHSRKHETDTPGVLKCLQNGCRQTFCQPKNLMLHTVQHMTACDIPDCSFISTSPTDLKLHKLNAHSIWQHTCSVCGKRCCSETALKRHLPTHKTDVAEGVVQCLERDCHKTFSGPSATQWKKRLRCCWLRFHEQVESRTETSQGVCALHLVAPLPVV
jgi:hypothetical protein